MPGELIRKYVIQDEKSVTFKVDSIGPQIHSLYGMYKFKDLIVADEDKANVADENKPGPAPIGGRRRKSRKSKSKKRARKTRRNR